MAYQDIENFYSMQNSNPSAAVVINNTITEADKPPFELKRPKGMAHDEWVTHWEAEMQRRWEAVGNIAEASITIKFIFLNGILDLVT